MVAFGLVLIYMYLNDDDILESYFFTMKTKTQVILYLDKESYYIFCTKPLCKLVKPMIKKTLVASVQRKLSQNDNDSHRKIALSRIVCVVAAILFLYN